MLAILVVSHHQILGTQEHKLDNGQCCNMMLHREVRDRVNPITGVIDEPRVNPLEVNNQTLIDPS